MVLKTAMLGELSLIILDPQEIHEKLKEIFDFLCLVVKVGEKVDRDIHDQAQKAAQSMCLLSKTCNSEMSLCKRMLSTI